VLYCIHLGDYAFRQYMYNNHFTLRINHKPLKWLTIVLNAYMGSKEDG
jgi:hypothetical protein